jgi:murein DD-endopeptidase MepM/ murein hydrolase activator NlpD
MLLGHLERAAPGLQRGARVPEGTIVGFVGDTGSPEFVHLHLEIRRMREGVDPTEASAERVVAPDVSVVCDPRNVLPLHP